MPPAVKLGPFALGAPLGSGGTATVYHAIHEPTGAPAAVKVVRVSPERRPVRNNLAAEVRAVVALDHPHVVQVFDLGEVDARAAAASDGRLVAGTPWYAMELADGGSLRQRLGALDWTELRAVLLDLLDALAHAHARGVLHLDLKPDNVLFGGRREGAKLGDFGMGLVGAADPDDDFVRGTPHFMAPEQVRGRWEELGPWTDLYALGCLAWRCLTGAVPFAASRSSTAVLKAHLFADPGPFELALDAPAAIEGWVRRLLNKDPEHRIRFAADASTQLVDLEGAAIGRPVPDWRVPEHDGPADVSPLVGLGLAAVRVPPVVGRTREREQLWEALRGAHDGEVRIVTLRGGPGVGKSRLARWLGVRAHELGLGLPLEAAHGVEPAPGDGLVGALRAMFPSDPRSADAESELGIRLQSRGLDAMAARDTASLLVRGPLAETPGGRPWWEAAADAVTAVAAERLPIVIVDDAQWADATLECLLALVRAHRLPDSVWLLTVDDVALVDRPTERELLEAIAATPGHRSIELGPLSELASPALARRMLALTPGVAAEVERRSAGSPGRQVDLVQDWARRGVLVPTADGYSLSDRSAGASALGPGPERLEGLLEGRSDGRIAVQVAATLGPTFTAEEWQEVTSALGVTVPPGLPFELLRARIVRRIEGRRDKWAFVDPHLREQVEGWSAVDPRDIHLACATCIDPNDAERRGRHLMAAGLPERAAPLLLRGLARTPEVGRAAALLALIDQAGPHVPWVGAAIEDQRVNVWLASGRPEDARSAAERQRTLAGDEPRAGFAAARNLARAALELGDPAADEAAARAERLAAATGDPILVARSWVLASQVARAHGRLEEARAQVEWASLLAVPWREGLELELEAAMVALAGGRSEAAQSAVDRLSAAAATAGARREGAAAALVAADLNLALGRGRPSDPARLEAALEQYRTARRRLRALDHVDEALAVSGLVAALVALGRDAEAIAANERMPNRLAPRHQLRRRVVELGLWPSDLGWRDRWREVRAQLRTPLGGVDPGLRALLLLAADRNPRPERARELRDG